MYVCVCVCVQLYMDVCVCRCTWMCVCIVYPHVHVGTCIDLHVASTVVRWHRFYLEFLVTSNNYWDQKGSGYSHVMVSFEAIGLEICVKSIENMEYMCCKHW